MKKHRIMKLYFSDSYYGRRFIKGTNKIYVYELNLDKPGIKDPSKGKWELVQFIYCYANGEKTIVDVTDDNREAILKIKYADEARIRKELRHKEMDDGYSEISLDELISNGGDIPSYNSDNENCEIRTDIENAVKKLPKDQQEIFQLRYFEDMTLDEIGQIIGFGKSNVCKKMKALIGSMRNSLI